MVRDSCVAEQRPMVCILPRCRDGLVVLIRKSMASPGYQGDDVVREGVYVYIYKNIWWYRYDADRLTDRREGERAHREVTRYPFSGCHGFVSTLFLEKAERPRFRTVWRLKRRWLGEPVSAKSKWEWL